MEEQNTDQRVVLLARENEDLRQELEDKRVAFEARVEELKANLERSREFNHELNQRNRENYNKLEQAREYDRAHLKTALYSIHEGKPAFTIEDEPAREIITRAFRLARLTGYRSEVEEIAYHLNCRDLLNQVDEEEFPQSDEGKRALMDTIEQSRHTIHPLDPRFEQLWRTALQAAQNAGMCAEFEAIAEKLGIPTDYEFRYSGYVEISVSGTISHYVEGYGTREEIRDGRVDFMDDFDITRYLDDINWEIDSEEIAFDE